MVPNGPNGWKAVCKREASRLLAWLLLLSVIFLYPLLMIIFSLYAWLYRRRSKGGAA